MKVKKLKINNFQWAAYLVNLQQNSSPNILVNNLNKTNDEKLAALVNSLISPEQEMRNSDNNPVTSTPTISSGKELYKMLEAYLQSKDDLPTVDAAISGRDETGCRTATKFDETVNTDGLDSEISIDVSKSTKAGSETSSTSQATKFQRVGEQGKIVSGYYKPFAEEKLLDFQATYVNIGMYL